MRIAGTLRRTTIDRIIHAIAEPGDSQEQRLQKFLLVGASFLTMLAGILWGSLYFLFQEPIAGSIPISYSVFALSSFGLFLLNRNYHLYRTIQLIAILILPFLLMVALGGFINSSAVILWSVLCPFGALLFTEARQAPRWMVLYLLLVIIGGFLQPYARASNNLPKTMVAPLFFVLNIGVVTGISFVLLYYFVRQRDRAYKLLQEEQDRSERLLLNVLPKEIAPILKAEKRTIADHFDSASVLFADIVGSTPLFSELDPAEAVDWLNEIFSRFDRLVEKYGLEKIRTIGDNYMVASGVPTPRPDHARAIALLALDMIQQIKKITPRNGKRMEFRLGINSGPLVAGVIGTAKFHYDVWGDTVNIASRMESHGEPGKVQVTRATYELLKGDFEFVPRGTIQIKGKGEMETWFLVSQNSKARLDMVNSP